MVKVFAFFQASPFFRGGKSGCSRGVLPSRASALGKIPEERAIQPLIESLNHKTEVSWPVRRDSAVALGNIGDERALRALETAFKDDPVEEVRQAAKEAIERIKNRNK